MPYVDEDWLERNASGYAKKFSDIADEIENNTPSGVSNEAFDNARDFINTIEDAAELLKDAGYDANADDEVSAYTFGKYKDAYDKLNDVAYREIPDVPQDWRITFSNQRSKLQDLFEELPNP